MSIWDKYPNYSEQELATLTKVASQVLLVSGGDEVSEIETLDLPSRVAAREVAEVLHETVPEITASSVQRLLESRAMSSDLSLQILGVLKEQPDLAELIAAEYEEATRQMAVAEILLAAALLVLVCKLKTIKISKSGMEITFDPFSEKITELLSLLLQKG
jgi:hypothetical protein